MPKQAIRSKASLEEEDGAGSSPDTTLDLALLRAKVSDRGAALHEMEGASSDAHLAWTLGGLLQDEVDSLTAGDDAERMQGRIDRIQALTAAVNIFLDRAEDGFKRALA
jgi:hypothetical protein